MKPGQNITNLHLNKAEGSALRHFLSIQRFVRGSRKLAMRTCVFNRGSRRIAMNTSRFVRVVCLMLLMIPAASSGQDINFKGQAIGWTTLSNLEDWHGAAGIRYIPELNLEIPHQTNNSFEAKASFNMWGSALYWRFDSLITDGNFSPFRLWAKYSGERFEIRAGLQKINFGSASMLRPLMWFDQIDPRDPLQLTDGVYGVLGRYYFLNNANIWLWGLYGNDKQKGWDLLPSVKNKPEFGGRVQIPVPGGELATTYHYRVADVARVYPPPHGESGHGREKRLALDGKFDLGVGLWFEAVLSNQEIHKPELRYQRILNLGMDYTFGLGNGLNVMGEYFSWTLAEQVSASGTTNRFSAVSLNYPFNIFTSINGILFYDWMNHDLYNFVNWSLQFDRWSFYIMGFWNPSNFNIYQGLEGTSLYAGKGLQFMVVFNH